MQHVVDDIRRAVQHEIWYPALGTALALPGICGWIETPGSNGPGDHEARYVRWFDKNLGPYLVVTGRERFELTGAECYALYRAISNERDPSEREMRSEDVVRRFRFVAPMKNGAPPRFVRAKRHRRLINLSHVDIDAEILDLLPREFCEKHQIIPVRRTGRTLTIAMADTANIYATDATRTLTHHDIEPVSAPEADLEAAVARHYSSSLDPRIQLDVPDFCDRACAAVEDWLVTIEDGAMLARLAGMMKIDRA